MLTLKRTATIASFPAFVLAARFIPFDRLPIVCAFYILTHYPCPSCGMTRSVMAIARLDFARAWAMNPLGFVFMGAFAAWWVNSVYEVATSRKTRLSEWVSTRLWMLVLAGICVLMVFGITRILVLIYR